MNPFIIVACRISKVFHAPVGESPSQPSLQPSEALSQTGTDAARSAELPVLSLHRRAAAAVLGRLGAWWLHTLTIQTLDLDLYLSMKRSGRAVIAAVWHCQMLSFMPLAGRYGGATLVSPSADGELGARIANRLGIETIRGDSRYRPSQALVALAHALRRGGDVCLFPDGPLGPPRRIKPGILALARLTRCPILPIGCAAAHKAVVKKSWDRFEIPLPYSRVAVAIADPIYYPRGADADADAELGERLGAILDRQTERAGAHLLRD